MHNYMQVSVSHTVILALTSSKYTQLHNITQYLKV